MKNLIAANWKMNPSSAEEAEVIFEGINKGAEGLNSEVVICPPAVYLPLLKGLPLGGQNMYFEDKGAFTGEISPQMLKSSNVDYVIIGHSERRHIFGETDELLNKKVKKALEAGLKIIFCIGETQEEHDQGKKEEVLERQMKVGLAGVNDFSNLNLAYEPVWAIGTGNNCSPEETKDSVEFIKKFVPENVRILYGGSVKSDNSRAYIKQSNANGLLVGGASLIPDEFVKIIKSAE